MLVSGWAWTQAQAACLQRYCTTQLKSLLFLEFIKSCFYNHICGQRVVLIPSQNLFWLQRILFYQRKLCKEGRTISCCVPMILPVHLASRKTDNLHATPVGTLLLSVPSLGWPFLCCSCMSMQRSAFLRSCDISLIVLISTSYSPEVQWVHQLVALGGPKKCWELPNDHLQHLWV